VLWNKWGHLLQVTRTIDLGREQEDHGLRNAWAAAISAVGVGALVGAVAWRFNGRTDHLVRYLIVAALVAFVLTPLTVSVYLSLYELTTRLLRSLRQDGVISAAAAGERLDKFARHTACRLNRWAVRAIAAVVATAYFAYGVISSRESMTSLLMGLLIFVGWAALAAILSLGVVTLIRMSIVCRAIGKLLREFPIHVQPGHPDSCGGLWIVGHMLSLVLYAAAILGGLGVVMIIAWHGTSLEPYHRPEPYLLMWFYVLLLPPALVNLLWQPHQLMRRHRDLILKPVAGVFDVMITDVKLSATENAGQLKAKADSLAEVSRQLTLLDDACPVWPLRMQRLRTVLVTAVLPVAVPIVSAVIAAFVTGE
jgi:hypothetical protein